MKKLLIIVLLLFAVPVMAADYTLLWNPNAEPDLAGYKVYWGTASRGYTSFEDVGNVTEYTLTLPDGTHYLAVTAYDTSGLESSYSNEINTDGPMPPSGIRFRPVARITIEIPQ